ncbi:MAG: hypothetical protein JRH07_05175 [Deltaproteobacteria bacterium]|nr:hypothetical protein [Deltaproteobacteria bacterium]MBW2121222.1 hypothetical protein [Deltaproteobacteria bacterium]
MAGYIRKTRKWSVTWLIIWAIMYLLVILAYPRNPSIWGGWLPSSLVTTFGLMVVAFVLGKIFCKQRFKS